MGELSRDSTAVKELDQLSRKELRELRSRIAELEDTERYRAIQELHGNDLDAASKANGGGNG